MNGDGARARSFAQALQALDQGDTARAGAIAEELRQGAPGDPSVQHLLATVAFRRGQPGEAERWALSSLAGRPDHYPTLVLAAQAARAGGDLPAALERFRRAADHDPARPEAAFGVVLVGLALRPDEATAALGGLAERFPGHADGWAEIGSLLERGARWEDAARAFGLALRARPSAKLGVRLGAALQALGRRSEAATLYTQALQQDPSNAEAWFKLGLAFQDSRHPARAAEAYRRALALRPDLAEAETNLGVVLQETGDLLGAKQAYGRAIGLRPSTFGRIAQALTTAPKGELWLDLGALLAHLSDLGRLSR